MCSKKFCILRYITQCLVYYRITQISIFIRTVVPLVLAVVIVDDHHVPLLQRILSGRLPLLQRVFRRRLPGAGGRRGGVLRGGLLQPPEAEGAADQVGHAAGEHDLVAWGNDHCNYALFI